MAGYKPVSDNEAGQEIVAVNGTAGTHETDHLTVSDEKHDPKKAQLRKVALSSLRSKSKLDHDMAESLADAVVDVAMAMNQIPPSGPSDIFAPFSGSGSQSVFEPEHETFELPRDILVSYFILMIFEDPDHGRLWHKYGFAAKVAIYLALVTPFLIQVCVTVVLVYDIDWINGFDDLGNAKGSFFLYNTISVGVLLIYIERDLNGYIRTVWAWLGRIETEKEVYYNPLHKSRIFGSHRGIPKMDLRTTKDRVKFIHFRILIFVVFGLYILLAAYSVIQITTQNLLQDKLESCLAVFFLLEIDDWACELFILQNGVLEDAHFDWTIELPAEHKKEDKFKRDSKYLWKSLVVLYGCLAFIMGYSIVMDIYF